MRRYGLPLILILFSMTTMGASSENPEFTRYPAENRVASCVEPKFSSYHIAQNSERHIKKDNPDRSQPNYAGKFRIYKHELMAEILWLIADCETGKFFSEKLSGLAEFKLESKLVILSDPNGRKEPQYLVWTGEEWTRVDGPGVAPVPSASPDEASSKPKHSPAGEAFDLRYRDEYPKYGVTEKTEVCKALDFNSYFRAQSAQRNIEELNPDRSKPNFAGHYLLLKNEVLFERLWLIVDCRTGKFLPEMVKGNIDFRLDSGLVVIKHSSEFAQLQVWRDERFITILNPGRTGKQIIENKFYDDEAESFVLGIGGSKRDSKVSFENLKCVQDQCSVVRFPGRDVKTLTKEQAERLQPILKRWGREFKEGDQVGRAIDEGKCQRMRKMPQCEIKLTQ